MEKRPVRTKRREDTPISNTPKAVAIVAALLIACSNIPMLLAEFILSNALLTWTLFVAIVFAVVYGFYIMFSISTF